MSPVSCLAESQNVNKEVRLSAVLRLLTQLLGADSIILHENLMDRNALGPHALPKYLLRYLGQAVPLHLSILFEEHSSDMASTAARNFYRSGPSLASIESMEKGGTEEDFALGEFADRALRAGFMKKVFGEFSPDTAGKVRSAAWLGTSYHIRAI
jgi:hypothetical protein